MAVGNPGYFPSLYNSAVRQGAEDYDSIMGQYRSLTNRARLDAGRDGNTRTLTFTPITPSYRQYTPGADLSHLREFAETGGYSNNDLTSLRERATSPVRAAYDSASRNAMRQRNLQGGYSPNFGAIMSKLAREQSQVAGQRLNDANANIAQMVQAGKLSGANLLSSAEQAEARRRDEVDAYNSNLSNQIARMNQEMMLNFEEFNRRGQQQADQENQNDFDNILRGIQGQQSLFGTPSAMENSFGNRVLQASQIASTLPSVGRAVTGGSPFAAEPFRAGANRAGLAPSVGRG